MTQHPREDAAGALREQAALEGPSQSSVSLLIRNLTIDCATKGLNPKTHAHRSRVIRQQTELLAQRMASDVDVESKHLGKRNQKAARMPDHRDEGGQG